MKYIIFALIIVSITSAAFADEYVKGYQRSNGTYVQPHYQTAPNNSMYDNYSTKGNNNPYTGQNGYVDPYKQSNSFNSNYNSGSSFSGNSGYRKSHY